MHSYIYIYIYIYIYMISYVYIGNHLGHLGHSFLKINEKQKLYLTFIKNILY